MRIHQCLAHWVALCVLPATLLLTGCSSWRATQKPPAKALEEKPKSLVRVTLVGASTVVLDKAWVSGDTLYGQAEKRPAAVQNTRGPYTDYSARTFREFYKVGIPNEDIRKLEIRKVNVVKTTLLVVLVGSLILVPIFSESLGPPSSF